MNKLDLASPHGQFVLRFIRESLEIEEVSIPEEALLAGWEERRGLMGAARDALELAADRQPVTVQQLCAWQGHICREQLPYGHWIADQHIGCLRWQHMRLGRRRFASPEEIEPGLQSLLDEVNGAVQEGASDSLELAARMHWRFELIHPFADGNGRTGRLVVLYLLRGTRQRPVLFTAGDRDSRYFRAFDPASAETMQRYFEEHQLDHDPWPPG